MNRTEFETDGQVAATDLFRRDSPAAMEGPPETWAFAQEVIDHGSFVLARLNQVRAQRGIRDTVTAALLRRALITTEGVRQLLANGLEEPALSLLRTLIEVRLNTSLVTADPTDEMAKRLGAFHYLAGQRLGTRLLGYPDTRAKLNEKPGEFEWTREKTRELKGFFESDAFADVRESVKTSQHWHGYANTQEAFEAAGQGDDYQRIFMANSPFVHVNNVDFDFAELDAEGRPALKALPQRDPNRTLSVLGGAVLVLLDILDRYTADRDVGDYLTSIAVREVGTDDWERVSPISIYQMEAAARFGAWIGMDDPPVLHPG